MMNRGSHERFDFGPSDDQYRGFEMGEEESARGPLILALAAGVLIVFAAVVWNTYRQGVRDGSGGVPLITADAGPYKRKPDNPGAEKTPGLDARFYDEMDGSERADPDEAEPPADYGGEILQGGPPLELRPELDDGLSDPETGMPNALSEEVRRLARLDGRPDDESESESVDVAAIAETPLPAPAPEPAEPAEVAEPETLFDFDPRGGYLVQIAAFREQTAAERAWNAAMSSHGDIFAGARQDIQRADLGARGVFYRLRVAAFPTRSAASEFCGALKQAGRDCIVVRK
jgi:hypothetical protein